MTLWVLCEEHGEKRPHEVVPFLISEPVVFCPGGREATPEDLKKATLAVVAENPDRFPPGFRWVVRLEGKINEAFDYLTPALDQES